ncbi:MAG TPA: UDP-N-acetylglucosamine 2-epimerase (non-hydrolyzing) [Anaerolineae bacterium]|nr:UDP-N-acetylglucosamine 2-epimerase (non-hydrolyzing) [Anaerolineae bacterium]
MKVLSVFGTRPEAVKMAPVIKCLQAHPEIESHVCVTGQHREMLDQVLEIFDIVPDYDLDIMKPNQSLSHITGAVLVEVEALLLKEKYDWLLVQGDTTTVMAASLAAFYQKVAVGHIEAGLRTYNNYQPFPEEANRRVTDTIANLLFAPTEQAQTHLLEEKIGEEKILVTGNTVVDALQYILANLAGGEQIEMEMKEGARLVLVTAHRRENFGEPLVQICQAIREIALEMGEKVHFLYPVHLNPNVQEVAYRELADIENVTLAEPLAYKAFLYWMSQADLILTDSGGVQEEATTMAKRLFILRETTERPEAVSSGYAQLIGTDKERIKKELREFLVGDMWVSGEMTDVFGDGKASERIVEALLSYRPVLG